MSVCVCVCVCAGWSCNGFILKSVPPFARQTDEKLNKNAKNRNSAAKNVLTCHEVFRSDEVHVCHKLIVAVSVKEVGYFCKEQLTVGEESKQ